MEQARPSAKDPKGYYACLRVEVAADTGAIKAAYRRLAKELHPDRNPSPDATQRFEELHQAYQVLSDPETRAHYDMPAIGHREDHVPAQAPEPVVCSRCGKVTAQPRYAVFRFVISLLVVTRREAWQGIYCATCARAVALRASAISAIAGWWGFPAGPVFTVRDILSNARGGYEPPGSREKLLWRNANAFAAQGKGELAYVLARTLCDAQDRHIALGASRLMNSLERQDVNRNAAALKSVWSRSPFVTALHYAMGAVVPLALIFAITLPPRFGTGNPVGQIASGDPALPAAPTCATPPRNGTVLVGGSAWPAQETNRLVVANEAGANAIVKIRYAETNILFVSFFVAKKNSATYAHIPDGRYTIQYAFGDALDPSCKAFVSIQGATHLPQAETFLSQEKDASFIYRTFNMTLHAVGDGGTQSIDALTFDAD